MRHDDDDKLKTYVISGRAAGDWNNGDGHINTIVGVGTPAPTMTMTILTNPFPNIILSATLPLLHQTPKCRLECAYLLHPSHFHLVVRNLSRCRATRPTRSQQVSGPVVSSSQSSLSSARVLRDFPLIFSKPLATILGAMFAMLFLY